MNAFTSPAAELGSPADVTSLTGALARDAAGLGCVASVQAMMMSARMVAPNTAYRR
jgi:hypothetical protein